MAFLRRFADELCLWRSRLAGFESKTHRALIVVSHYAAWPDTNLKSLLKSLADTSGDVVVCINDDTATDVCVTTNPVGPVTIRRPNIGMNIGAWNEAWQRFPEYDLYLFLQEDCVARKPGAIRAYAKALARPGIGMVGESINPNWDLPWREVAARPLNYELEGSPGDPDPIRRVDYYLARMHCWGIPPGPRATHLRALVWAFHRDCLAALGGFPVGMDKEECIAAEIAVSRKVVSLGYTISQVSKRPFTYFSHPQWRLDGSDSV